MLAGMRIGGEGSDQRLPAMLMPGGRTPNVAMDLLQRGQAAKVLEDPDAELDPAPEATERGRELLRVLQESCGSIEINRTFVPHYGDRYRYRLAISTAFTESTINQVVSKRMVKKQPIRWTARGAHHLHQMRTKALNGDLRHVFARDTPGCAPRRETTGRQRCPRFEMLSP